MKLKTLGSVIEALYYTRHLEECGGTSRGGLMLVADPESLKSEILKMLEGRVGVSWKDDLNVKSIMSNVRPAIARGQISALVFPEFQKLLERRDDTSKNTMGHLRSFVHDGIFESAHDNPLEIQEPATCLIFAALTLECFNQNIKEWMANGFARRVLWVHFRMMEKDKELIRMAHRLGVGLELFARVDFKLPVGSVIPSTTRTKEKTKIDELFLKYVDVGKVPYRLESNRLLYWILDVLKWEETRGMIENPMAIIEDFIPSMGTRTSLEFPKELWATMEQLTKERLAVERSLEMKKVVKVDVNGRRKTKIHSVKD